MPKSIFSADLRHAFLLLHRWLGLLLVLPLLLLSITGGILVFKQELDHSLNKVMMQIEMSEGHEGVLSIDQLEQNIAQAYPDSHISWFDLSTSKPYASVFWLAGTVDKTGQYQAPRHNQVFVNPYTGQVLGGRNWGDMQDPITNLIPLVYRLHYSLLSGQKGSQLLGFLAIAWLVHILLGWRLTLPESALATSKNKWALWLSYWCYKPGRSYFQKQYFLHRWLGLCLTPVMLIFILSGLAFNLKPIYYGVLDLFLDRQTEHLDLSVSPVGQAEPMGWKKAVKTGEYLMAVLAQEKGFSVEQAEGLSYSSFKGLYMYRAQTSLDLSDDYIRTSIWFDGATGQQITRYLPTGFTTGDTLTHWVSALHMGKVGWLSKVLVLLGAAGIFMLLFSGAKVGWIKWQARRKKTYLSTGG